MTDLDPNWRAVAQFVSDLQNASRLAAYVDTVLDIYESGAWRRYTDATGRTDDWRACEFDYFLIACGAEYSDVQRLLTWDRARAVELAAAMDSDEPQERRGLDEASDAWQSPAGVPLSQLATQHGWTKATGELRVPPAPGRARARARHGVTMDQHARETRERNLPASRRLELDAVVIAVCSQAAGDRELRYLIDALRDQVAARKSVAAGK